MYTPFKVGDVRLMSVEVPVVFGRRVSEPDHRELLGYECYVIAQRVIIRDDASEGRLVSHGRFEDSVENPADVWYSMRGTFSESLRTPMGTFLLMVPDSESENYLKETYMNLPTFEIIRPLSELLIIISANRLMNIELRIFKQPV